MNDYLRDIAPGHHGQGLPDVGRDRARVPRAARLWTRRRATPRGAGTSWSAIRQTADRLGNTPAVCRQAYVHPAVVEAYLDGRSAARSSGPPRTPTSRPAGTTPAEERAVIELLRRRLRDDAARVRKAGLTMAILAGLLGFVGRFAGKVLTTTLGWASTLLFGRVPADRQIVLALITFGSVVWAALAIGVVLPYVGAFLVAAVPAPGIVDGGLAPAGDADRRAGGAGGRRRRARSSSSSRPSGRRARAIAGQVLRGYPLSAALAVTLVLLALVGIARFVHHLARRWTDAHVAVVVRPGGYERVVADLERALDDAGLAVDRRPAPAVLAVPGRMLGSIAGPGVRSLVPDKLVQLAGAGLEVGLYPSDIAISGDKCEVARARAAIASRLVATAAWMTMSAEAQEIEAAPRAAGGGANGRRRARSRGRERRRRARPVDVAAELRSIDEALAILAVPHEEWEVLYRQRLQVERDLLAGLAPGASFPGGGPETLAPDGNGPRPGSGRGAAGLAARAIAAGGLLLRRRTSLLALAERCARR